MYGCLSLRQHHLMQYCIRLAGLTLMLFLFFSRWCQCFFDLSHTHAGVGGQVSGCSRGKQGSCNETHEPRGSDWGFKQHGKRVVCKKGKKKYDWNWMRMQILYVCVLDYGCMYIHVNYIYMYVCIFIFRKSRFAVDKEYEIKERCIEPTFNHIPTHTDAFRKGEVKFSFVIFVYYFRPMAPPRSSLKLSTMCVFSSVYVWAIFISHTY